MADTKISQLPAATTPLSGAELVPLVQSGATVQTPVNDISLLTAATANTFTANQIISVTDNTNAALRVTQLGTGLALRIEDSANPDSTPVVVDASGNLGVGTVTPSSYDGLASIFRAQTASNANLLTFVDGTSGGVFNIQAFNDGVVGSGFRQLYNAQFWSVGTGVPGAATERFRIDINGNALVTSTGGLGYGTGAGGTVTQTTNKNTAVTLNKTTGQITMASNNLAANATAVFNVFSDKVTSKDVVVVSHSADGGTAGAYTVTANTTGTGFFNVRVTNVSGGTLAEAVVINFVVIKGSNA